MDIAEPEIPPHVQPKLVEKTSTPLRIGIAGASGFIGGHLIDLANRKGLQCVAFSRDPKKSVEGTVETRQLDDDPDSPPPDVSGLDAVVNLAGESIMGLWSTRKRDRMMQSRVQTTRKLVAAMAGLSVESRPSVFLNASGMHHYGDCGDDLVTEKRAAQVQDNFLAEISTHTEAEASQAEDLGVRVCMVRIGMVLGAESGAFPLMHGVFRKGLGGNQGSGRQWMSWIHVDDLARLILYCVKTPAIDGPVNATSPRAVRNEEFTNTLSQLVGRPAVLHTPAIAMKLMMGEMANTALFSIHGVPQKAMANGFSFEYPELEPALRDLIARIS